MALHMPAHPPAPLNGASPVSCPTPQFMVLIGQACEQAGRAAPITHLLNASGFAGVALVSFGGREDGQAAEPLQLPAPLMQAGLLSLKGWAGRAVDGMRHSDCHPFLSATQDHVGSWTPGQVSHCQNIQYLKYLRTVIF